MDTCLLRHDSLALFEWQLIYHLVYNLVGVIMFITHTTATGGHGSAAAREGQGCFSQGKRTAGEGVFVRVKVCKMYNLQYWNNMLYGLFHYRCRQ